MIPAASTQFRRIPAELVDDGNAFLQQYSLCSEVWSCSLQKNTMERKEVVFVLGGPGSGKGTHVSVRDVNKIEHCSFSSFVMKASGNTFVQAPYSTVDPSVHL